MQQNSLFENRHLLYKSLYLNLTSLYAEAQQETRHLLVNAELDYETLVNTHRYSFLSPDYRHMIKPDMTDEILTRRAE